MIETRRIVLNGQKVNYTFKRSNRRSIGLRINGHGLTVSAPLNEPLTSVESVLSKKANWLFKHLTHCENKQSTQPAWEKESTFLLLDQPWHLTLNSSDAIQMTPGKSPIKAHNPITLTPHQIETFVMAWYNKHAITCFNERAKWYANMLGVPVPPIHLSRAKTRWGSCNSHGVIRLNWRLMQMPIHLVDYVVIHELSHLIEMNHSPAFWHLVESICPAYQTARKELKTFSC